MSFIGSLGLAGALRESRGILSMVRFALRCGLAASSLARAPRWSLCLCSAAAAAAALEARATMTMLTLALASVPFARSAVHVSPPLLLRVSAHLRRLGSE